MTSAAAPGPPVAGPSEPTHAADDYDQFVDWDARLAREGPFFRALFDELGAGSVADVGAGSGRHALLFASWGLTVYPIDPDPAMLAHARANAEAAGAAQTFYEGGFGGVAAIVPAPVDAITCTGNALPHVDGLGGLRVALADFAAALRPGGGLALHLLNHQRLLESHVRSIPPVVRETPDGTKVFLRVLSYEEPDGIAFDFLTLTRGGNGDWTTAWRRSLHTALPAPLLAEELERAGFERVTLFGNHQRKAFDAATDESVILLAYRR